MNDRAWLLNNNAAISCAKSCIRIIKKDFGVKLTLSDPKLLEKVQKINDHLESSQLGELYKELVGYAGKAAPHSPSDVLHALGSTIQEASHSIIDRIEHHGKEYPKFDKSGREFKGVYRGSARYA